jgi:hypothetical protein
MTRTLLLLCLIGCFSPAEAGWKKLFNGKDTDGWQMTGPGRFVVEDGQLKTEGGMGLLYFTREKFGNTVVKVVFRTTGERANSGVVIRMPEAPPDPWYGVHEGFEVQIDAGGDEWHCTGAVYSLSRVSDRTRQKPSGEWNTMLIDLRGPRTIISLNGKVVNDFDPRGPVPERKIWYEPVRGPRPDAGFIGLQNHDAKSTVYFREISVKTKGMY